MILGIDEVGRGPWAGPLVVGAVVLPDTARIDGLTDSKRLSAKRRQELAVQIRELALGYGLGWVTAEEIDQIGLGPSLALATKRAVQQVTTPFHEVIIDGTINFLKATPLERHATMLPKADALIPAVSAASIIAKVARDAYMEQQAALYPEYGFDAHVGYGTARHLAALQKHGVTPLHRRSFAPVAKIAGLSSTDLPKHGVAVAARRPSSKTIGSEAETLVAKNLIAKGYSIEARNWRTKYSEIDIVAVNQTTRLFVEVKFRSATKQGDGFDAITPNKLRRMHRAAEAYCARLQEKDSRQPIMAVAAVNTRRQIKLIEVS